MYLAGHQDTSLIPTTGKIEVQRYFTKSWNSTLQGSFLVSHVYSLHTTSTSALQSTFHHMKEIWIPSTAMFQTLGLLHQRERFSHIQSQVKKKKIKKEKVPGKSSDQQDLEQLHCLAQTTHEDDLYNHTNTVEAAWFEFLESVTTMREGAVNRKKKMSTTDFKGVSLAKGCLHLCQENISQNIICRPQASASPGNMSGIQILGLTLQVVIRNSGGWGPAICFNKCFGDSDALQIL